MLDLGFARLLNCSDFRVRFGCCDASLSGIHVDMFFPLSLGSLWDRRIDGSLPVYIP